LIGDASSAETPGANAAAPRQKINAPKYQAMTE